MELLNYRKGDESSFDVIDEDTVIATFTLRKVNRALCFSCKLKIFYPGKGYYKHVHALKTEVAKKLGYTAMLATVRQDNEPELRCIDKYGWVRLATIPGIEVTKLVVALTIL